jgi:hypothetical protein
MLKIRNSYFAWLLYYRLPVHTELRLETFVQEGSSTSNRLLLKCGFQSNLCSAKIWIALFLRLLLEYMCICECDPYGLYIAHIEAHV